MPLNLPFSSQSFFINGAMFLLCFSLASFSQCFCDIVMQSWPYFFYSFHPSSFINETDCVMKSCQHYHFSIFTGVITALKWICHLIALNDPSLSGCISLHYLLCLPIAYHPLLSTLLFVLNFLRQISTQETEKLLDGEFPQTTGA